MPLCVAGSAMKGQKERENKKIELNAASHKKEKIAISASA
jgi:hypothetical protein